VKTAFRRLVNLVPRRGRMIAYDGSTNVDECVSRRFVPSNATASNLDLLRCGLTTTPRLELED